MDESPQLCSFLLSQLAVQVAIINEGHISLPEAVKPEDTWQGLLCRKHKMKILFAKISKYSYMYLIIIPIFWKCSTSSGCVGKNIQNLIKCT